MRYPEEVIKTLLLGVLAVIACVIVLHLVGCGRHVDVPVMVPVPSIVLVPIDNVIEADTPECTVVTPLACPVVEECPVLPLCETIEVEECSCKKIKRVRRGNGRYNILRIDCGCELVEREVCYGGS